MASPVDARAFLRSLGVGSELGDDELSGILAQAAAAGSPIPLPAGSRSPALSAPSSAASAPATTPSTSSSGNDAHARRRRRDDDADSTAASRLSLPSDVLDDLRSPPAAALLAAAAASSTRGGGGGGGGRGGLLMMSNDLRREYDARIEALVEEVATLKHERRLAEVEAARAAVTAQGSAAAAREEAIAAAAAARTREQALQAEVASLSSRLEASKAAFADQLMVSAATAEELARIPRERLSLLQHAQLQTHTAVAAAESRADRVARELEAVRRQAADAATAADIRSRELQAAAAAAAAREAGLRETLAANDETVRRLQARVAELSGQVESLSGKGAAYDAVEGRRREAEALAARDNAIAATSRAAMQAAQADRDAAQAEVRDLTRRCELLAADKASLATALEEARSTARRTADALTHAEDRLREAITARDASQQQLITVGADTRSAAESRLHGEVARLRETAGRDMEEARAAMRESYEREIRSLRDARADASAEVLRLQSRLDTLQRAFDDATAATRSVDSETVALVAELRGQLKVKVFELERLAVVSAEQADAVARLSRDNDDLRGRYATLHEAHVRLEASFEREITVLTSALSGERDKVAMYERLETELDTAIVAAGDVDEAAVHARALEAFERTAGSIDEGGAGAGGGATATPGGQARGGSTRPPGLSRILEGSIGFALATGVPTTARRRLQQTVALARELVATQRDNDALKKRIVALTTRSDEAVDAADGLRRQLDAVAGPQAYLVAELRRQEADSRAAKAAAADARAETQLLRQSLRESEAERRRLTDDLQRLMASRKELDGLIALVRQAMELRATSRISAAEAPSVLTGTAARAGDETTAAPAATAAAAPELEAMRLFLAAAAGLMSGGTRQSSAAVPGPVATGSPASSMGGGSGVGMGAGSGMGSGASTPLGTASTRNTTPPHDAAPATAGSAALLPPAELRARASRSGAGVPLTRFVEGADDAPAYTSEMPLAGGIAYVAGGEDVGGMAATSSRRATSGVWRGMPSRDASPGVLIASVAPAPVAGPGGRSMSMTAAAAPGVFVPAVDDGVAAGGLAAHSRWAPALSARRVAFDASVDVQASSRVGPGGPHALSEVPIGRGTGGSSAGPRWHRRL